MVKHNIHFYVKQSNIHRYCQQTKKVINKDRATANKTTAIDIKINYL